MTYPEVLDFMFQSLPMYHRLGAAAYKADLSNTESLMEFLNHPERDLRCIHVAGTNGKGSVSHLTAALLQTAGFKVGLYTSPHLVDFRERIRIGGQMIPQNEVVDFITHLKDHFDLTAHPLSFFEMTVGLAFHYFQKEHVDYAVIEVGLGGRLDSTNVIQPLLSVITNIGLEHTQFLGDTLPKIAAEKAGIIKPNAPVIIGETQPETQPVFDARAKQCQVPIVYADQQYAIHDNGSNSDLLQFSIRDIQTNDTIDNCQCPLAGSYQFKNIITFVQVAHATTQFIDYSHQPLSINQLIHTALGNVKQVTGFCGRWEVIDHKPLVVCETAHNADGVHAMLQKLNEVQYDKLHLIYGCVSDKDFSKILQMLPQDAQYYYTQPSVPRALPAADLAAAASQLGMDAPYFANIGQAYQMARKQASQTDMILITGSIFLVADALKYFKADEKTTVSNSKI